MEGFFQFEFWWAWGVGCPVVIGLLLALRHSFRGLNRIQRLTLYSLRAVALFVMVGLLARPVWVQEDPNIAKRPLCVLLDHSLSMSLADKGESRYRTALDFLSRQIAPAAKAAGVNLEVLPFARDATLATPEDVLRAKPDGDQTDLGRAIEESISGRTPAALLVLSDGASNQSGSNQRALSGLLEGGIPLFGIGFGSEKGVSTLNLSRLDLPDIVPPNQSFSLGVQLDAATDGPVPPFVLSLYRDGQLLETRKVDGFSGTRFWLETFTLKEAEEGEHQFLARLDVPPDSGLVVVKTSALAEVRVSAEKEFRVLFVQGALTWDFKFIARALGEDPSVKLTGLSRTSEHSIFRQNVEAAGELLNGFPEKLEEIAKFRVVVLSDLKPADFNIAQQETLARFCRELGGGVLMLGGAGTFGPEWAGSQVEQLLPVKFEAQQRVTGLDPAFHLQLTQQGLRHPAFQIAPPDENTKAWATLPTFTQYGRVSELKPGAVVLAEHERDVSSTGRRILMASQRYGAGQSAVICVQNFWRWRLAKEAEGGQFDRFWRQFLRWLGETSRKPYEISFPAQDLRLGNPVQFIVERQAGGKDGATTEETRVEILGPDEERVLERQLRLGAGRSEGLEFVGHKEGLYRVKILGGLGQVLASRSLELKKLNLELHQTARDMEGLQQWAAMTQGTALRFEDFEGKPVMEEILSKVKAAREARRERMPLGLTGWVLALILGALSLEWILRRKWKLR